ncbi:MAG TPA: phage major capsid protein [Lachnospiraceae bacterium]|nr:phage major capsid protein [Lachnospiraceae bacterium]
MFEKLNTKKAEIEALIDEGKVKEAKDLLVEYEALKEQAELKNKLELEDRIDIPDDLPKDKKDKIEYNDIFIKAFKGKKLSTAEAEVLEQYKAALSSTTGAGEDGGYIIPQDIQTAIKELKRDLPILENYMNIEPVSTLSGSRVVEKYADIIPFVAFAEGDDVPGASTPQFVNVPYTITDKGGILPVPNNLMSDTDQNLMAYLKKWLLRKSITTRNSMIVTKLKTLVPVAIADFDDIKEVLNVTLDPMLAAGAIIITNQDGYNYLDTLRDADGNYILKADVTNAKVKVIEGKPVVTISNKQLPTVATKAPLFMGDIKEFATIFDREQMSILATNIGGTAFSKNRTDVRAIVRDTIEIIDADAVVYGELTV